MINFCKTNGISEELKFYEEFEKNFYLINFKQILNYIDEGSFLIEGDDAYFKIHNETSLLEEIIGKQ